ncbi:MAG: glutathione ABC transporter permease GsiD, partial [Acetobacteraceae bacterium]
MSTASVSAPVAVAAAPPRGPGTLRRLLSEPGAAIASLTAAGFVLAAVFAPWLAGADPYETNLRATLRPPDAEYWLGTDAQGRDLVVRCLHGLRLTLLMGFVSVLIGGGLGILTGFLAA